MALYDDKLSLAVEKLGRYFSIVSKESFMALLAFGDDQSMDSFGNVSFDPAPAQEKLVRIFTDSTEGGAILVDVLAALEDLTTSLSSDEEEELWWDSQSLYFFVGEPDTFDTTSSDTRKPCSPISVKDFCQIPDEEGAINSTYSSPTKYSPNLSGVKVIPVKLTPAQRDTGAVALFLNAIPTLEFSRCVPYLDITLITPQAPLSDDNRIQSMSLMKFLRGGEQLAPDSVNSTIQGALDLSALGDYFERMEQLMAAGDDEGLQDLKEEGISTAGMEIFTSPQTLINADEKYEDYSVYQTIAAVDEMGEPTGETTSVGGKRGAPIIDRMRPFMAIDSFNITVTPSRGMMSHKTADITLVLFDRSRLTEIAPFVKPDLYGRTELLITYGWSHPDDSAAVVTTAGGDEALTGNFFGTFLNALKVKEKYGIVNSSFSFDEVGQVKIKLKLSMKGASNIDTTPMSKGEGVDEVLEQMQLLCDAIQELKAQIAADAEATGTDQADVSGGTFLGAAGDTSSAMAIDEETQEAISKYINDNQNAEEGSTEDQLVDNLTAMFGEDGTGGVVAEAKATIAAAVGAKVSQMKAYRQANKDPFMRSFTGSGGATTYVDVPWASNDFVSLGSVLMYYVGKPLAATRRFDEVQFVFYAFNEKASYLKDVTIADFPIKIETFEKKFTEITKNTANIPLGKFIGFLNKEFIHNQASYIYGLAALYETDEETGEQKLSEELTEDATALNNEKKLRLEDAYGSDEDLMFKMPRVTMHIETVPIKPSATNGGAKGTILRIHLYDNQATKYSALGKMMSGARSDSIGMISSAASAAVRASETDAEPGTEEYQQNADHQNEFIDLLQDALDYGVLEAVPELVGVELDSDGNYSVDPEEFARNYFRIKGGFPALKGFIQASMPTIIYGSQNSAVVSADLSSMNNARLATINMQRSGMGGGTGAQGARDTGLPLQTAPTKLSLTTLGCPIVGYGQNFFVDFGTGTTVDNVYVVSGIGHSIQNGKFETKLKMTQVDAFGKFTSAFQAVEGALTALSDAAADDEDSP